MESSTGPRRLYIDEIGRASRDAIEALRLGKLIEKQGKVLIGVTDGFDSRTAQAKMILTMFAMVNEMFVDQLSAKVIRGMADAFRLGKNVNGPVVGYRLEPVFTENGEIVVDEDGQPVHAKTIDEDEAKWVLEAFRRYVDMKQSPNGIARAFNRSVVAGRDTWDRGQILEMLRRTAYVGVEYYGMRKQIRNSETGQQSIIWRPESEWLRRESPHLRIISDELWEKAQRRMQACRDAYSAKRQNDQQRNGKGAKKKGQSRSAVYPRTLFRPLCAHCKTELWFGKSGKYSSFCCPNGRDEKCGCKLKTHKSVQIVEEVILAYLRDAVFTPTFLQNVLVEPIVF